MKEVVQDWTKLSRISDDEAKKWYATADSWRLPYWDWAAKQSYVDNFACPEVLTLPTVRIFPPESLSDVYPQPKKYPNPFWDYENPEQDDDGNPLPFGDMPAHVEDFNISADGGIPVSSYMELLHLLGSGSTNHTRCILQWDKTSGTSRYGIFREKDKSRGKEDEYKYHGLKGVNNVWQANAVLSSMNTVNQWYEPPLADDGGPDTTDKDKDGKFIGPGTLADAVGRMFSDGYHSTYEQFSSTKWYGSKETQVASGYLSLEYIHNNVHVSIESRTAPRPLPWGDKIHAANFLDYRASPVVMIGIPATATWPMSV